MKAMLCICVLQFFTIFYKKLINVLNPKTTVRKNFFILGKKSFVIPFKSHKILGKESEINLKFPGS